MKIEACLVNGLEIVGFQMSMMNGTLRNYSLDAVHKVAIQKKVEGVTCKDYNGQKILVNVDYNSLPKIPIQKLKSYRTALEEDKLKSYVTFDNNVEEQEITDSTLWNTCVGNVLTDYMYGLAASGNDIVRYVYMKEGQNIVGQLEDNEDNEIESDEVETVETVDEIVEVEEINTEENQPLETTIETSAKKRGRPKKVVEETIAKKVEVVKEEQVVETVAKKRGRPKKEDIVVEDTKPDMTETEKKRGRPKKEDTKVTSKGTKATTTKSGAKTTAKKTKK